MLPLGVPVPNHLQYRGQEFGCLDFFHVFNNVTGKIRFRHMLWNFSIDVRRIPLSPLVFKFVGFLSFFPHLDSGFSTAAPHGFSPVTFILKLNIVSVKVFSNLLYVERWSSFPVKKNERFLLSTSEYFMKGMSSTAYSLETVEEKKQLFPLFEFLL